MSLNNIMFYIMSSWIAYETGRNVLYRTKFCPCTGLSSVLSVHRVRTLPDDIVQDLSNPWFIDKILCLHRPPSRDILIDLLYKAMLIRVLAYFDFSQRMIQPIILVLVASLGAARAQTGKFSIIFLVTNSRNKLGHIWSCHHVLFCCRLRDTWIILWKACFVHWTDL
mgnify:FL=1